ncbi:MAG: type II toxin-antitoxin system VapC family toxin [Bacteroidales bacterium]|nr:type II toxin-antitoxin system VapC family toxin [Bacteroidales bacterium]
MRYYLDTNVLIYVLLEEMHSELSTEAQRILEDYSNSFYVSSVAVRELIHAYKTGGIQDAYHKSVKELFEVMEESGIEIVPMNKHHLLQYAALETAEGHKDPNDHIIIAQAISDKIPIISSDRMFKHYTRQGLAFVYNKR